MSNKKRIVVSNVVKQHTNQLCRSLIKITALEKFYTTIWYKPNKIIPRLLTKLPIIGPKYYHMVRKRYDIDIQPHLVQTYPWYEYIRQLKSTFFGLKQTENDILKVEQKHDNYTLRQLKKKEFDIFIGSEKSCLNCFKYAKSKNKITILDLAQVHYKYIDYLRFNFPVFKSLQTNKLFNKISARKQNELKYVDHIFTLSTFAQQTLIENGIPKEKTHILNLGFDPTCFKPKNKYNTNTNQVLQLLFVGTVTKRKGIHILLEAVKNLNNVKLEIVGPILDGHEYLEQYKNLYEYSPFLHHDKLAEKYANADLFVFPSYLDSWAMVVLEAMASGTPVIVTENTGSKDAVCQGGGKIIPIDNVQALINVINFYNTNRDELKKDGQNAYKIAQNYTWANYYKHVQTIINQLIIQKK